MPDVLGEEQEFHDRFKFRVELDGITFSDYSKCSALEMELGTVEHRQGGRLTASKSPGLLNFSDITLERGATKDTQLEEWFKLVADASAGVGGRGTRSPLFKRNGDIVQLDRDDTVVRRYRLRKAWPKKLVLGEWDNNSEEHVIHTLTLVFEYAERVDG